MESSKLISIITYNYNKLPMVRFTMYHIINICLDNVLKVMNYDF